MDVFLFGAGYSAQAYAKLISGRGIAVAGTTRKPSGFQRLKDAGIQPFLFHSDSPTREIAGRLKHVTHLIVSAAPDENGDPVLRRLHDEIASSMPALKWIGYLSTVGVYGNHDGAWIDEEAECRPVSARSRFRVAAEKEWIILGDEIGIPTAILRLAGIYGPGRNAFAKLEAGTARRLVKPGQVFNRIHVTDIARAIDHLGERQLGGIFNVTDNEPSPPQDVVAYAANLMGVDVPPDIPFDSADLTPMARSFYGENKRVSNAKIRQSGFSFSHPDYRSTLDAIWSSGEWK